MTFPENGRRSNFCPAVLSYPASNYAPVTRADNWVKYPFYPGYSLAGRVVEVGEGVTSLKAGDRVALRRSHSRYVVARRP